jgi:CAAX prenyl protease-like protein
MTQPNQLWKNVPDIYRWVLPFVLYLAGTAAVSKLDRSFYPIAYAGLVAIIAVLVWQPLRCVKLLNPHRNIGLPVLVGLIGVLLWIPLAKLSIDEQIASYLPSWLRPSARQAYNPFAELEHPWLQSIFVVFRLIGLAAIVPIAEELFWRGFLLRWLVSEDWQKVPLATYTPLSFIGVVAMFTLAHPEWTAAAAYCSLLTGYFYWKKDLWGCTVAHAVSNLLLAIYVLATRDWILW